jgi:AcrR family transcriptional regulator
MIRVMPYKVAMNEHHSHTSTESDGRGRILRAAYDLFIEHGFKAVSMQQIADASQITKATLYHHFLNKEALFTEVMLMAMQQMRAEVAESVGRGGSASDQLTQFASRIFARTQSDFGRLTTDMHENISVEQRNLLLKERSFPLDLLEEIIAGAVESGELPEVAPGLAVSMFIGLVWGQIWTRKMEWIDGPLNEDLARVVVDIFFAGLRHAPSTARGFSVRSETADTIAIVPASSK